MEQLGDPPSEPLLKLVLGPAVQLTLKRPLFTEVPRRMEFSEVRIDSPAPTPMGIPAHIG